LKLNTKLRESEKQTEQKLKTERMTEKIRSTKEITPRKYLLNWKNGDYYTKRREIRQKRQESEKKRIEE
jgi:hypothetical protein